MAEPHDAINATKLAGLAAEMFLMAGRHVRWPASALDVAALGDTSRAGLLAAAIGLRAELAKSAQGREALREHGFPSEGGE